MASQIFLTIPGNSFTQPIHTGSYYTNIHYDKECSLSSSAESDQRSHKYKSVLDQKFLDSLESIVQRYLSDSCFGVEKLGNELHMSRVHLHRKLKCLLDQSPTDYIKEARLKKSLDLLRKRDKTIGEIAYSIGFSNPSYFSDCFKKQFGVSPKDFISSYRK